MATRLETTADVPVALLAGVLLGAATALLIEHLVRPRSPRDGVLALPFDDEPVTPADLETIAAARAAAARGEVTSWPELRHQRRAARAARSVSA